MIVKFIPNEKFEKQVKLYDTNYLIAVGSAFLTTYSPLIQLADSTGCEFQEVTSYDLYLHTEEMGEK